MRAFQHLLHGMLPPTSRAMASPNHPFHTPGLQIPRFLFRGFNKHSGGGIPGQNTTEGITPLGFLQGHDTEMELSSDVDPSRVMVRAAFHCSTIAHPPTPFSSWSHDWRIATIFACTRDSSGSMDRQVLFEDDDGAYIAVLDTWSLGSQDTLRNKIFHDRQMGINLDCEWLIWGPISGPAYRCVPLYAIRQSTGCPEWPFGLPMKQGRPYLLPTDVRESMLVAGCFQRGDDASADVMLAVAAAELARRMWGACEGFDTEHEPVLPIWPRDVLGTLLSVFALCQPVLSGRPLVHGDTAVVGLPRVRLMYTLLSRVEALWGVNNPGTPWKPVDWQHLLT